jgi:hypothetical protein
MYALQYVWYGTGVCTYLKCIMYIPTSLILQICRYLTGLALLLD